MTVKNGVILQCNVTGVTYKFGSLLCVMLRVTL